MIVLGVDPGLAATGYGLIELSDGGLRLLEGGVIRSEERDDMARRVGAIFKGMSEVLAEFKPDILAMEEIYSHYKHPKTAIIMAHARGAVLAAATHLKIPVRHYAATTIKMSITGNGRAKKEQVREAILQNLNLTGPPDPLDTYDAIAAALCHINHKFKAAVS